MLFKVLFIFSLASIPQCKVISVIEVFRHGARAPTVFIPELNDEQNWPEGAGELIPEGMRQHYLLGSFMRKRYIEEQKLISPKYNKSELYVFSSDYNRTIMSAVSHLQGLFPAGSSEKLRKRSVKPPIQIENFEKINEELGNSALPNDIELIPIHSDVKERQFALGPHKSCKPYMSLIQVKKNMKEKMNEFFQEYHDVISGIIKTLNFTEDRAKQLATRVVDSLISFEFRFGKLPAGFEKKFLDRGIEMKDKMTHFWQYEPDLLSRFAGTALLNTVIDDFKSVIGGSSVKMFLYSAHDTTIASLLAFLKMFNSENPYFASYVLFELILEEGQLYVDLMFNGNKKLIPGCSENCTWDRFQEIVRERSIPDYYEVCGGHPGGLNNQLFKKGAESDDSYFGHWTDFALFLFAVGGISWVAWKGISKKRVSEIFEPLIRQ